MSETTSRQSSKDDLIRQQQMVNEHHKHGCCNKRYHCDGTKCPNGRVLNPAIGIPLAVCTGGLSVAATGMYRGVRDHKRRNELKKAYEEADQLERKSSDGSSSSRSTSEEGASRSAVEIEATPATSRPTIAVEKMDDSLPAELESPAGRGPPPKYAELDGT